MVIKLELVYDQDSVPPLKLFAPNINPALIVSLLSQAITGVCSAQIETDSSSLIVPAKFISKIPKLGGN